MVRISSGRGILLPSSNQGGSESILTASISAASSILSLDDVQAQYTDMDERKIMYLRALWICQPSEKLSHIFDGTVLNIFHFSCIYFA